MEGVRVVGGFGNVFDDSILVGDSSLTGFTLEELVVELSGGRVENSRGTVRVRPVELVPPSQIQGSDLREHSTESMTSDRPLVTGSCHVRFG